MFSGTCLLRIKVPVTYRHFTICRNLLSISRAGRDLSGKAAQGTHPSASRISGGIPGGSRKTQQGKWKKSNSAIYNSENIMYNIQVGIFRRRSEVAITRRTRNAFVGSSRHMGSNPIVSASKPDPVRLFCFVGNTPGGTKNPLRPAAADRGAMAARLRKGPFLCATVRHFI